jgi:hypothetical protein
MKNRLPTRMRLDLRKMVGSHQQERMIGRVGLVEHAAEFIAQEWLGPGALDQRFDFDAFKTAMLGINAT